VKLRECTAYINLREVRDLLAVTTCIIHVYILYVRICESPFAYLYICTVYIYARACVFGALGTVVG
jgi:hypothetical protein